MKIFSLRFILFNCYVALSVFGTAQTFATFAAKKNLSILPYETPNEFPSLAEFESEEQFKLVGLTPLSTDEIIQFIDRDFDEQLEDYLLVAKIKLNAITGLLYYHQLFDTDSDIPSYDYVLIVYNETGKQLSRLDLLAYEWITNLEENDTSINSGQDEEEEELFREMNADYQEMELETFNDSDVIDSTSTPAAEESPEPNTVDEGYAISSIYSEGGKIYIQRRTISYFNGEAPESITFKLNDSTGVFEEQNETYEK